MSLEAYFHSHSRICDRHNQKAASILANCPQNTQMPPILPQESGSETPSSNQASSINGTDDEKISHVSPEAALLKSENDLLKTAVEQR